MKRHYLKILARGEVLLIVFVLMAVTFILSCQLGLAYADSPPPANILAQCTAPNPPGNLWNGRAIAFDGKNLYFTYSDGWNRGERRVFKIDTSCNLLATITLPRGAPGAIAFNPATGTLWGAAYDNTGDIFEFNSNGTVLRTLYRVGYKEQAFNSAGDPYPGYIDGLEMDSAGNLVFSTDCGNTAFTITTAGTHVAAVVLNPSRNVETGLSGLTSDGVNFWHARPYQSDIFQADSAGNPTDLIFRTFDKTGVAYEAEDITFDDKTFAPKCAVWANESSWGTPRIIAYEVTCPNRPPTANAGPDQTVSCAGSNGTAVTLDGSGSSDPDGDALTYSWSGVFGTATGVNPQVQIPLGTYTVTLKVDDGKGGTAEDTVSITVEDKSPPSTSAAITGTSGNNGWYKSDVNVSLTSADNCSGVKEIHYMLDGVETVVSGSTTDILINNDGTHSLNYWAVDNSGNVEQSKSSKIKIDKTLPTITASANPAANANGWNNTDVTVTFTCNDSTSGIASCTAATTVTTEGAGQLITGSAVDNAGNTATASVTLNIDKTSPVTQATLAGTFGTSCYSSDVNVTLAASDALSGIAATYYRINEGDRLSYGGTFTATSEGSYQIGYESIDKADNSEAENLINFTIDKTPLEAVIRFDTVSKDIKVYNNETDEEASYIVLSEGKEKDDDSDKGDKDSKKDNKYSKKDDNNSKKDTDDSETDKEGTWELRQYTLQDCANNTLILTLKHKKEGKEVKVKIVNIQYNSKSVIEVAKNKIQAEYSENKDGTLKELEQKIKVNEQFEIEAKYSGKKNETEIKEELEGQKKKEETREGIVILELLTDKGSLNSRY